MKKLVLIIVFFGVFSLGGYSYALDGVEVLSGFFSADIRDQGSDYKGIPLLVAFDFDAKPLFEKIGLKTQGRLDFVVEPFLNTIIDPDLNLEVGSNFLIKYVFPLSDKVQPYAKVGLGALYMSQHTREQSTQYNFLPQAAGGFHFFITEKTALSCEYRYRHLSNASFKHPNKGIDAGMILGGISFLF
ncbi:MAG: acyloxyacyl hydrolase [Candidatus Omnitrophica bacterium]|nr:acyloxyacyl hydrolase [Candidatus Omnitrophota bacterium]